MGAIREIAAFNFNTSSIRVVTIEGNPWFLAIDVCNVLGLSSGGKGSTARLLGYLDDTEKKHVLRSNVNPGDVSYPNRGALLISESGLYKLIMRSDKPQAKAFQDWVTKEVLPSIRKTGSLDIIPQP